VARQAEMMARLRMKMQVGVSGFLARKMGG
jgi:hypothetical protein